MNIQFNLFGTTTSNYFEWKPKYIVTVSPEREQEIFDWVRECCHNGFRLNANAFGHSSVELCDDRDYVNYLLKWSNA